MAPQSRQSASSGLTYSQAGVDIDAANALVKKIGPLAAKTRRPGVMGAIGGFGGLFDLKAAGYADPVLVAAADDVGTKLKIAMETDGHDTIGIDLVAMCVNDLVVQGAEPLFFLDYFACGKLNTKVAERIVAGIAEGCRRAGCALIGGETAEMPGMYPQGDYDLAGFAVGAVERDAVLPRLDMAAGDALIGLASSGAHSNGFSLIRRIVDDAGIGWDDPAPFDRSQPLRQALLTPTRIYVKPVLATLRGSGAIKALAHITGGGLPENLPRVLPNDLAARIDLTAIPVPDVFSWLADSARLARDELLRTFNCGVGMVVVAAAAETDAVAALLTAEGETAFRLGALEPRNGGESVRFTGDLDLAR